MSTCKTISIDGVEYVRKDLAEAFHKIPGKRAVVVVDRGWVFAGDVTRVPFGCFDGRRSGSTAWSPIPSPRK